MKRGTRLLSLFLTFVLCFSLIPQQVFAAEVTEQYLEEVTLEDCILQNDLFYLATTSASVNEWGHTIYLLRLGRGGDCTSASTALVKIADVTAEYGKDYTVRIRGEATKTENPEDNESLMALMEEQTFTQSEMGDEEELEATLAEDEEAQSVLEEGVQAALTYLEEESGLAEKYPDGYNAETVTIEDGAIVEEEAEELDEVEQARAAFTGLDAASQELTTDSDAFQDMQSVANVLTAAVVGASLEVEFAPGESEKYLEIIPKNNLRGDGDRLFYLLLGAPSGTTTNSSASSCAITILDDEEQEPSVVSFSSASYTHTPGEETVTITVERTGAINSVISAVVRTTGAGEALAGRDYSEVDRTLLFPFGVSSLTVDIPVRTEYFTGEADFGLSLTAETDCTVSLGTATVSLLGTYGEETEETTAEETAALATLQSVEEPTLLGSSTTVNNLSTLKTLSSLSVSSPHTFGHENNYYGGNNSYDSSNSRWAMDWEDNTIWRQRTGTVGAIWELSTDEGRYWLAGAQVSWKRTGNDATMRVDIDGRSYLSSYFTTWGTRGESGSSYDLYSSSANFDYQTLNMYPSESSIRNYYSYSPHWIAFYNRGNCDDCNWLWIYDIKPILRPFQIKLQTAEALQYLQADGTYAADDGSATRATLAGGGNEQVCFLDDSFTVSPLTGSNVQQYAALSSLRLVNDAGEQLYTLASGGDATDSGLTWTLSKSNLSNMVYHIGRTAFRNTLKENPYVANAVGYANYSELLVQPVFSHVASTAQLKNPYDFPITYTISGTDYTLDAHTSRKISFNLGDTLALTKIAFSGDAADDYAAVGVSIQYKISGAEANYTDGAVNFTNHGPIYLGGSSTGDNRLSCKILNVEPNLQDKDNKIVVRVKTSELADFNTTTGLLSQTGTVNGSYTEFVFANTSQTANGKLYFLTATPADSDSVCVWYDKNTDAAYEGNTLYFTAGTTPSRNVLTLSTVPATKQISLCGSLFYMNYNLNTLNAGSASAVPAFGATVAAGSASAVVGEDGKFQTGTIGISGASGHYLRYLVSVNGTAIIREAVLPTESGTLDVSGNFSDGVSPVTSDIFYRMNISGAYPTKSSYDVLDGNFLPISSGEQVTMTICIKPTTYSISSTGESGLVEETKTENPKSVQLVVYDSDDQYKGKYSAVTGSYDDFGGYYTFTAGVDFAVESDGVSFSAAPGDKLYLRLTTDRTAQAGVGGEEYDYTYSDVYTGYSFVSPASYEIPVEQGLDCPITVSYDSLPLLGTAGMFLEFPHITVGWTRIDQGYRMYIGASVTGIIDAIKKTNINSFTGDDGVKWGGLFSLKDPFNTFATGLKASYAEATKGIGNGGISTSELGSPQWRFDLSVGVYFDFYTPSINGEASSKDGSFYFAGVGAFMSATLGFKVAWYFIIPVVCIPAYFCIELSGTVLGTLGAEASGDATLTMDEARNQTVDFDDKIDDFTGSVTGIGMAQFSLGVGLCGTIGLRVSGRVRVIGSYEPSDIVSDTGAYIGISAGIIVDLFLFSIPLMFELKNKAFGSFEEYQNGAVVTPTTQNATLASVEDNSDAFQLREGNGDSTWKGDWLIQQGAFGPSSSRTLVSNAYEHPDSQIITMSDGTVVLAFVDSDSSKGVYQRTTVKLATYKNNKWSTLVSVCEDDTADFQPSIAETKDGKVLVAWISTGSDNITEDTSVTEYLNSLDVFAAFATINSDGSITMGDATRLTSGSMEKYYDSKPTVVCDPVSGDALVFYVKSGCTTDDATVLANPYANDSAIGYMYYNAEADNDSGREIPAGWLLHDYYRTECASDYTQVSNDLYPGKWGGQRFLAGPSYQEGGKTYYYAIPDFTAIAYNGLAVFSYTVDTDSDNDTDADKELYVQVFNFAQHQLKYKIQITDDEVSDTLPQFFRSKQAGQSTGDENTHTKLFWYRDGTGVCYIDVTKLIKYGITDTGKLKASGDDDYVDENGKTHYKYAEPIGVGVSYSDSNESAQMADFRVAEDADGSLYVLWTESVTNEKSGKVSQEIFATCMKSTADTLSDEEANARENESAGWSKPYQLTKDGYCHDELAVTLSGEDLIVVHNRFHQTLVIPENYTEYEGVVDYNCIEISDMELIATTMEPCGAVEVENITLTYPGATEDDEDVAVTLPKSGEEVKVAVTVCNNGLTTAKGFKLTVYAVTDEGETKIYSQEISKSMAVNTGDTYEFLYTLPETMDGLTFKAVTQEKKTELAYYRNTATYTSEPLEAKPDYVFSNLNAYQTADGFRLSGTVQNQGNQASGAEDLLTVSLSGPFNMELKYAEADRVLYSGSVGTLAVGASRDFDIPIDVDASMMEKYGFVNSIITVSRGSGEDETRLSEIYNADFTLVMPMNFSVGNLLLCENTTQTPCVSMELGDRFGSSEVSYAVEDLTVATIRDGRVQGVAPGTTTLYAIHNDSGTVTSATVTVCSVLDYPAEEKTVTVTDGQTNVAIPVTVSEETATISEISTTQIQKLTEADRNISLDLTKLTDGVSKVSLPVAAVKELAAAMDGAEQTLTVKLPDGSVTLDAAALASIAEKANGSDLQLQVASVKTEELTTAQKTAASNLKTQEIFELSLTSGGKSVSDFEGKATVQVACTPAAGKCGVVWSLSKNGSKTWVPSATANNTVTFAADALTTFALTYTAVNPEDCTKDDSCLMLAFADLEETAWYHDAVHYAMVNGLMNGVSSESFAPQSSASRAMLVTMLWRMAGCPEAEGTSEFQDVPSDAWYSEAVCWAKENGLVSGYSADFFAPNEEISREQIVAILYRYAKLEGAAKDSTDAEALSGYTDAEEVSDWALDALQWAVEEGILTGMGDGTIGPKADALRAQIAAFLMRYETLTK